MTKQASKVSASEAARTAAGEFFFQHKTSPCSIKPGADATPVIRSREIRDPSPCGKQPSRTKHQQQNQFSGGGLSSSGAFIHFSREVITRDLSSRPWLLCQGTLLAFCLSVKSVHAEKEALARCCSYFATVLTNSSCFSAVTLHFPLPVTASSIRTCCEQLGLSHQVTRSSTSRYKEARLVRW